MTKIKKRWLILGLLILSFITFSAITGGQSVQYAGAALAGVFIVLLVFVLVLFSLIGAVIWYRKTGGVSMSSGITSSWLLYAILAVAAVVGGYYFLSTYSYSTFTVLAIGGIVFILTFFFMPHDFEVKIFSGVKPKWMILVGVGAILAFSGLNSGFGKQVARTFAAHEACAAKYKDCQPGYGNLKIYSERDTVSLKVDEDVWFYVDGETRLYKPKACYKPRVDIDPKETGIRAEDVLMLKPYRDTRYDQLIVTSGGIQKVSAKAVLNRACAARL